MNPVSHTITYPGTALRSSTPIPAEQSALKQASKRWKPLRKQLKGLAWSESPSVVLQDFLEAMEYDSVLDLSNVPPATILSTLYAEEALVHTDTVTLTLQDSTFTLNTAWIPESIQASSESTLPPSDAEGASSTPVALKKSASAPKNVPTSCPPEWYNDLFRAVEIRHPEASEFKQLLIATTWLAIWRHMQKTNATSLELTHEGLTRSALPLKEGHTFQVTCSHTGPWIEFPPVTEEARQETIQRMLSSSPSKAKPESSFEVPASTFLTLLQEKGGVAYRWEGGFWCTSPPQDLVFGDSPQEAWIGSTAINTLLQQGTFKEASFNTERLVLCEEAHLKDSSRKKRPSSP